MPELSAGTMIIGVVYLLVAIWSYRFGSKHFTRDCVFGQHLFLVAIFWPLSAIVVLVGFIHFMIRGPH